MTHDEYAQHLAGLDGLQRVWDWLLDVYASIVCRVLWRVTRRRVDD